MRKFFVIFLLALTLLFNVGAPYGAWAQSCPAGPEPLDCAAEMCEDMRGLFTRSSGPSSADGAITRDIQSGYAWESGIAFDVNLFACNCAATEPAVCRRGDICRLSYGGVSVNVLCAGDLSRSGAQVDCPATVMSLFNFADPGVCAPATNGCRINIQRVGRVNGCGTTAGGAANDLCRSRMQQLATCFFNQRDTGPAGLGLAAPVVPGDPCEAAKNGTLNEINLMNKQFFQCRRPAINLEASCTAGNDLACRVCNGGALMNDAEAVCTFLQRWANSWSNLGTAVGAACGTSGVGGSCALGLKQLFADNFKVTVEDMDAMMADMKTWFGTCRAPASSPCLPTNPLFKKFLAGMPKYPEGSCEKPVSADTCKAASSEAGITPDCNNVNADTVIGESPTTTPTVPPSCNPRAEDLAATPLAPLIYAEARARLGGVYGWNTYYSHAGACLLPPLGPWGPYHWDSFFCMQPSCEKEPLFEKEGRCKPQAWKDTTCTVNVPGCFDCTGYVRDVYLAAGAPDPGAASSYPGGTNVFGNGCEPRTGAGCQIGDILVLGYPGPGNGGVHRDHVMLWIAPNCFIDSSWSKKGVSGGILFGPNARQICKDDECTGLVEAGSRIVEIKRFFGNKDVPGTPGGNPATSPGGAAGYCNIIDPLNQCFMSSFLPVEPQCPVITDTSRQHQLSCFAETRRQPFIAETFDDPYNTRYAFSGERSRQPSSYNAAKPLDVDEGTRRRRCLVNAMDVTGDFMDDAMQMGCTETPVTTQANDFPLSNFYWGVDRFMMEWLKEKKPSGRWELRSNLPLMPISLPRGAVRKYDQGACQPLAIRDRDPVDNRDLNPIKHPNVEAIYDVTHPYGFRKWGQVGTYNNNERARLFVQDAILWDPVAKAIIQPYTPSGDWIRCNCYNAAGQPVLCASDPTAVAWPVDILETRKAEWDSWKNCMQYCFMCNGSCTTPDPSKLVPPGLGVCGPGDDPATGGCIPVPKAGDGGCCDVGMINCSDCMNINGCNIIEAPVDEARDRVTLNVLKLRRLTDGWEETRMPPTDLFYFKAAFGPMLDMTALPGYGTVRPLRDDYWVGPDFRSPVLPDNYDNGPTTLGPPTVEDGQNAAYPMPAPPSPEVLNTTTSNGLRRKPAMRWWDTGYPSCEFWEDAVVGAGYEHENCAYGGWNELKLYQARCMKWFGLGCICDFEKTFKNGIAEEFVIRKGGGTYQDQCYRDEHGNEKVVTSQADVDYVRSINRKTYACSFIWPLAWRGYVGHPEPEQRFPNLGRQPASPTNLAPVGRGLDGVIPGDIIIYDRDVVGINRLPHVAYVMHANNQATCTKYAEVARQTLASLPGCSGSGAAACAARVAELEAQANAKCNSIEPKDTFVVVQEYNYGKYPDTCGTTSMWGIRGTRHIYKELPSTICPAKPGTAPDVDTMPCENPEYAYCYESLWDSVKYYRASTDQRREAAYNCTAVQKVTGLPAYSLPDDMLVQLLVQGRFTDANNLRKAIKQEISEGCDPPIKLRYSDYGLPKYYRNVTDVLTGAMLAPVPVERRTTSLVSCQGNNPVAPDDPPGPLMPPDDIWPDPVPPCCEPTPSDPDDPPDPDNPPVVPGVPVDPVTPPTNPGGPGSDDGDDPIGNSPGEPGSPGGGVPGGGNRGPGDGSSGGDDGGLGNCTAVTFAAESLDGDVAALLLAMRDSYQRINEVANRVGRPASNKINLDTVGSWALEAVSATYSAITNLAIAVPAQMGAAVINAGTAYDAQTQQTASNAIRLEALTAATYELDAMTMALRTVVQVYLQGQTTAPALDGCLAGTGSGVVSARNSITSAIANAATEIEARLPGIYNDLVQLESHYTDTLRDQIVLDFNETIEDVVDALELAESEGRRLNPDCFSSSPVVGCSDSSYDGLCFLGRIDLGDTSVGGMSLPAGDGRGTLSCAAPPDMLADSPQCLRPRASNFCDYSGSLSYKGPDPDPFRQWPENDPNYRDEGYSQDFLVEYIQKYRSIYFTASGTAPDAPLRRDMMLSSQPVEWLDPAGAYYATLFGAQGERIITNPDPNSTTLPRLRYGDTAVVIVSDRYPFGLAGVVWYVNEEENCVNIRSQNWLVGDCQPGGACQSYSAETCYQAAPYFGLPCIAQCIPYSDIRLMWTLTGSY